MPHIDLLELPYFAHIPLGEVVSLIDAMAPMQLQPGQLAVAKGALPEALLITTAGTLAVRGKQSDASPHSHSPCALPVRAFFAREQSPIEAAAVTVVSCFALPYDTFARLLQARHPALAPFLCNLLAMPAGLHEGLAVG